MSQIALFKLVETTKLNAIMEQIEQDQEQAVQLCREIDADTDFDLPHGECSGLVFTAVFDYLESVLELDFMEDERYIDLLEFWQAVAEPLDLMVFDKAEKEQILNALQNADMDDYITYIGDGWDLDEDMAAAGLGVFKDNLAKVDDSHVMLYFLY